MPRVDLKRGEQKKHVARALKEIQNGYIIAAPLEHGYVFLTDAFSPYSVRAMHVLRGNEDGVAAQVLVHNAKALDGIAREIPQSVRELTENFWPGLLSLNLKPNRSLSWDLGDDHGLDLFSVRAPKSSFIRALLKASGPLAVASAAPVGQKPLLSLTRPLIESWNVSLVFDKGALRAGPLSSVVEVSPSGLTLRREGAISYAQLLKVAPSISLS